jgi:hypothetical protein
MLAGADTTTGVLGRVAGRIAGDLGLVPPAGTITLTGLIMAAGRIVVIVVMVFVVWVVPDAHVLVKLLLVTPPEL